MVSLADARKEVRQCVQGCDYKQLTPTELKKLREARKDVHFKKPFIRNGGYKPGEEELETFRSKMYAPKAYDALAPLWHLRKHMGGVKHNIRTLKDFCTFLLTTDEAAKWGQYLLSGYASAHRWAKDSSRGFHNQRW